ncbi:DUF3231 family protein [Ferdinandcohnia sp. Marseille-Q9671]
MNTHKAELTASEISNLWTSYQNDTMAKCAILHFIANCDDEEILSVLKYALSISESHIEKVTKIFEEEGYPIPKGYTDEDLNLEAPRLFTDKLYLLYIVNMGKFGLSSYGLALSIVVREDILEYYTNCLDETKKLHNEAKRLAVKKGVLVRPPIIPRHEQVDFVKKQNFLTGYFGNRRPLLGVEIANLHYNAERNALGLAVIIGFSQVVKKKEVRRYFERGRDISQKHLEVFNSILEEEYMSGVMTEAQEVTDSTVAPFSDRLMMYHITALTASAIGQYGISMSTSPRHDIGVMYERLKMEIVHFSDDGANIMIKNGWLEQPPMATNRKELAREKKN